MITARRIVCVGVCVGIACHAPGQTDVEYNRKMLHTAITPSAVAPDRMMATAVFTVEAAPLATETEGGSSSADVSTTVVISVNGVPVASIPYSIQIDASSIGPCGGTCGSGVTNGMAAAMLCIEGVCQFPPLTASAPLPPLSPGDDVRVLLMPAPGAMPDSVADNAQTTTYQGDPVGWNRRITHVDVVESSAAPEGGASTFDVNFDVEYASFGIGDPLRMGVRPVLLINGVPTGHQSFGCGEWLLAPSAADICEGCTLFMCGTGGCGGGQQLFCRIVENQYNLQFCGCVGEDQYSFQAVPLAPGDEIVVVLFPAPGALPELPGFEDDDSSRYPDGCLTCPGDLNGDGVVNGADLAALLAGWGMCDPF